MGNTAKPIGAGKTSFDLIDAEKFFSLVAPEAGSTLLDAACGPGRYTLFLAGRKVPDLRIVAVDVWEDGIRSLRNSLSSEKIEGVTAHVADISNRIPAEAAEIDLCLMATVVHDLIEAGTDRGALSEVCRVLKPNGRLAVVEFKKIEGPPGPPLAIRLSDVDLAAYLTPYGFEQETVEEIGPVLYLSVFRFPGPK
ncbi:MAG: class I SAM-dependent methyltransferase [Desulfobacterales bacterium]